MNSNKALSGDSNRKLEANFHAQALNFGPKLHQ